MTRIVITGANGQMGRALTRYAYRYGYPIVTFTSQQWNITDPTRINQVLNHKDIVINCAAYTDVDGSQSHLDQAYAINAIAAGELANSCRRYEARFIHLSTDYVFNGQFATQPHPYIPSDSPDPINVYGASKLAGERLISQFYPEATIVRTSWIYTGIGNDFLANIRKYAEHDNSSIPVVDDQIGSPTFADDLAHSLFDMIDHNCPSGIIHLAGSEPISRYHQARMIMAAIGENPDRIRPVKSNEFSRPAPRPAYSALQTTALNDVHLPRRWTDGLIAALAAAHVDSKEKLAKRIESFIS